MKAGMTIKIADFPDSMRWVAWSQSDACPGAWFATPGNDAARATGVKYLTVKVKQTRTSAEPEVTILACDPASLMPKKPVATKRGAR